MTPGVRREGAMDAPASARHVERPGVPGSCGVPATELMEEKDREPMSATKCCKNPRCPCHDNHVCTVRKPKPRTVKKEPR
jgi:hypothetical protein